MVLVRQQFAAGGTFGDAFAGGGATPAEGNTTTDNEEWNGITWKTAADLSVGRRRLSGAGSTAAGLAFGGDVGDQNQTEEYAGSGVYRAYVTCALTGSQA